MQNRIFKLSMVAAALVAANSANAALYKIVPVDANVTANQVFSSAISDSSTVSDSDPLGCFSNSASCDAGSYQLGGDTRLGEDGISYRDEVPFKMDNRFIYQDLGDIRSYCDGELGYQTCDTWAKKQWFGAYSENDEDDCDYSLTGGLCQERRAFYQGYNGRNAVAIIDGSEIPAPAETSYTPPGSSRVDDSANTVINKVLEDGTPIGIASSGYYKVDSHSVLTYRQRGFYGTTFMLPKQDGDTIVKQMGRTFAYDSFDYNGKTYVVGSASVAPFNYGDDSKDYNGDLDRCMDTNEPVLLEDCQNFAFATQAYVWNSSDGASGKAVSGWENTTNPNSSDDYAAQGSARTAVISDVDTDNGKPVLGGFNTHKDDDNYLMQAAIFYPKDAVNPDNESQWDSVFVRDAEVEDDGDYIYSNSLIKDMNKNLIAIGEAKRSGRYPKDGASNNRLFYTDASKGDAATQPVAVYLSGDIFFGGAGGEANAINNYNEMVGSIDAEQDKENDGKERRRRGFIDPLNNLTGTNADRLALFQGKAWWLDNLTNGANNGDSSISDANNAYRIVNATGINDDGVISATANYCDGGYDNTTHNSYCGDGKQDEKLVAVKLIPIAGATSDAIVKRGDGSGDVEREGAGGGSLGYLALTLLGLLGFRRKKIKM